MIAFYLFLLLLFSGYHLRAWQRIPLRQGTMSTPCPSESFATPPVISSSPMAPKVSVLVPVWNAAQEIGPFVAAFRALQYSHKELVLCAGGRDGSFKVAAALQNKPKSELGGGEVRVLEQLPGEGKQGGLAKCFAASSGSVMYLTDIDCRVDDESFLRVLTPLLEGREAVVTGSSKPNAEQQRIGAVLVHWALVRKAEGRTGRYVSGLLGRNCAVSKEVIEATGGFNFSAPTGTDYRLAQELSAKGYRIWLEPESEIQTAYAWPLASYIRKRGRWVRNVLLFAERPRQNAEYYNALSVAFLPAAMLAALFSSGVAAAFSPPLLAALPAFFALLLLLHGALNRLRYVRETLGRGYQGALRGAFVNWTGQLLAGLYAFFTWIVPPLRKQW